MQTTAGRSVLRGRRGLPALKCIALAVIGAVAALDSQALVTTTGNVGSDPASVLGPGNVDLPAASLYVDGGSVAVDGGSLLHMRLGVITGSGLVTGAGSSIQFVGNGMAPSAERLFIGNGTASFTVAAGGTLDTSLQYVGCLAAFHYCDTFVGHRAGDMATLTVTGAGSQARIGGSLFVGHPGIHLDDNGTVYGVPAGTANATVNVLDGGALVVDRAQVGTAQWETHNTGAERSVSHVTVSGAGSRWTVVGGQAWNYDTNSATTQGASIITANDRLAVATIDIEDGAKLQFNGIDGTVSSLGLTTGGGRTDMTVRGTGSAIAFSGSDGVMNIGRQNGSARLSLLDGGQATGLWYTSVGRDGSFGELVVDGAGSLLSLTARSTAAASGTANNAIFDIGRNGTGAVTVSGGARIEIVATQAAVNSPQLSLGRDAASSGTLTITGAGSVVSLSATSSVAGGGASEAYNPWVRVGRDGTGVLNVSNGGKLLLDGQAVSTLGNERNTTLYIGGTSDTVNGGRGIAAVSGAGSEIRLTGSDTYIGIGHGPQSYGSLTVSNQALVSTTSMVVGRSGGVGTLAVDNARIELTGQYTGNAVTGAALTIGRSGGIGVASLTNGSTLLLRNMGDKGASLNLGGSSLGPLGDGTLTLSGGSTLKFETAPGLATLSVGRDGSGLMRVRGASTVDLGDGHLYVGRLKGSDGTLLVSENSTITAGWVGVGRNRIAGGDTDGGTATMVLNNSTLTAPQIVIGTNGFLGGNGTIVGNVTNYGIFSPGNSPGTMTIDGSYTAAAGSRLILEVESDGHGGFNTDKVIFAGGGAIDLAGLNVEFRFLGTTDPNAFQAAGLFDIDHFLVRDTGGGYAALDDSAFQDVSFGALSERYVFSNFSYTAGGGALFTAAVPEPGTWLLMLAGLAAVARAGRRAAGRGRSPA